MTAQESTSRGPGFVYSGSRRNTQPANGQAYSVAQAPGAVMSDAQQAAASFHDGDKELWEAGKFIEAYRRERIQLYNALRQRDIEATELKQQSQAYGALVEQYESLKVKYTHTCADLSHALGNNGRLMAVQEALDDEKSLRLALDLELQQVKAELCSRDATINSLQEDIKAGESKRDRLQKELDALDSFSHEKAEAMQDFDEQEAFIAILNEKNSSLTAEIASQKTIAEEREDQIAALTCKLESANLSIEALKQVQHDMKHDHDDQGSQHVEHSDVLECSKGGSHQSLQDENMSLNIQLSMIKETLRVRFPDLHDNLENLPDLLNECGEGGRRTRRKTAK